MQEYIKVFTYPARYKLGNARYDNIITTENKVGKIWIDMGLFYLMPCNKLQVVY